METAPAQADTLTPSQRRAINARGNVLVMAGAGTGTAIRNGVSRRSER